MTTTIGLPSVSSKIKHTGAGLNSRWLVGGVLGVTRHARVPGFLNKEYIYTQTLGDSSAFASKNVLNIPELIFFDELSARRVPRGIKRSAQSEMGSGEVIHGGAGNLPHDIIDSPQSGRRNSTALVAP